MLAWDRHAERWIVSHRVAALDPVFRWLTYAGTEGALWLALGLALAVMTRRRQVFLLAAATDLVAQLVVSALQALFGRERPDVDTLVPEPHGHSFPSGHATSSVACAIVLAAFAPRLGPLFLLLAAAIAFSRLYVGVHYPLDVVGGAALGAALAWAALVVRARALPRLAGARRRSRPGRREG